MNFCSQKIALFLVKHALTKYLILQNNFHFSLTNEQRAVLNCASLGHNLLVSGQAGTGKSTLVNSIIKELTSCMKKVKVVCSSGISCSLCGDSINSQTVHSCYGLQTADMPSHMVVGRSLRLPHCMEKIHAADVLIWDEAAMSSRRIFELVNAIHHAIETISLFYLISTRLAGKTVDSTTRHVLILRHYHTRCLTSATPECNVRSEKSVTVPSRLNAPIVL